METKVIMVTGATAGIGLETARRLAGLGHTVVGVGRDPKRIKTAVEKIKQETGNPEVHFLKADLSSQEEVRRVAREVLAQFPRLDVLVNNAGAIFFRREETVDGYEMTWGLNHLGYFLLTKELLPRLKETPGARIVNVASNAHLGASIYLDDPNLTQGFNAMKAYGQSKLANILFTKELARRLKGTGVTANVLHPGLVRTNFTMNNGLLFRLASPFWQWLAIPVEDGARTPVYLSVSPEVAGISGDYFVREKSVRADPAAYDETVARRLWDLSETQTGS